ncbi:hypothetical protein DER45DRAFT_547744, partial [Fusarium avenaceum]
MLPQAHCESAGRRDMNSLMCIILCVCTSTRAADQHPSPSCRISVFVIGSSCDNPPRYAGLTAAIISIIFPLSDYSLTVSTGVERYQDFPLKSKIVWAGIFTFRAG